MGDFDVPRFVKWAGGKHQLLNQFEPLFPKKFNRYFEPFVGGGAVAFYILQKFKPKEVFLSDINEELINAFNVIKTDVDRLIVELKQHKEYHKDALAKLPKKMIREGIVRRKISYLFRNHFEYQKEFTIKETYDIENIKDGRLNMPGYAFRLRKEINNKLSEHNFTDIWNLDIAIYEDGSCEGKFESAPNVFKENDELEMKINKSYIQASNGNPQPIMEIFNNYLLGYYNSLSKRVPLLYKQ